MRVVLVAAAAAFAAFFAPADEAHAQSLQCRQQLTPEQRELCAEREIDDLDDKVKYWRSAAHQPQRDYDHFANRRLRCQGNFECLTRELQMETSELQVTLEPAARLRLTDAYSGPVVYQPAGQMSELDALIDRVITRDSWGWMLNRYDRGSVRNTHLLSTGAVYSDYTYNGGMQGWVIAYVVDGRFTCVEYHDFAGRCRPVGARSYAYGIATRLALAAAQYALTH